MPDNIPVDPQLTNPVGTIEVENSLGVVRTLPNTLFISGPQQSFNVPRVEILNEHGAQKVGKTRKEVAIRNITGYLKADTAIALDESVSDWTSFLFHDPLKIFPYADNADRYFLASMTAFNATKNHEDTLAGISGVLESLDPFSYARTENVSVITNFPGYTYQINVPANANVYPRVSISSNVNGGQNFGITSLTTGLTLIYNGQLDLSGPSAEIDCDRQSAKLYTGVGILDKMGPDFFLGWHLRPGINNLRLEGSASMDVYIYWRNRWH